MPWIDSFLDYTENLVSPLLFRQWAGISIIAAVLERKVWVHTLGSNLYPNLYILLIAPPGIGKTELTWRAESFVSSIRGTHIASGDVTKAALIDDLADAKRAVGNQIYNSLYICINEMGVLLPQYDMSFMSVLTDLYDGKKYKERKRGKNKGEAVEISEPQLNLLAAGTPAYLRDTMPEGAWDQGFTSRSIIVYSGERQIVDLFSSREEDVAGQKALTTDLRAIAALRGQFDFEDEAIEYLRAWHASRGEPEPTHPRLLHYNTRRTAHLLKLSMIAAASNHCTPIIKLADAELATVWLLQAEAEMPNAFKAMTAGGTGKIIEEAWYFLFQVYTKTKKPVPEARLISFLSTTIPPHQVMVTIEMMEKAGLIKRSLIKGVGNAYTPHKPEH